MSPVTGTDNARSTLQFRWFRGFVVFGLAGAVVIPRTVSAMPARARCHSTAFVTNAGSGTVSTIDVKTRTKNPNDITDGSGAGGVCERSVRDHGVVANLRLETPDLMLTEVEPEDLPEVLAVRCSNPDRLRRTEGSGEEAGTYDLPMLERDVAVALADPARHVLVARARADRQVVGYVDVLDVHPDDGRPWLGVVEIQADAQRRGLGRECVQVIARRAHDVLGARVLRAAADLDDDRAQMFLRSLGFAAVDTRERSSPEGRVRVIVYEAQLVPGPESTDRVVPESSWLHPNLEVRRSSIEGSGLFAVRPIEEGEVCAVIGGQVLSDKDFARFVVGRARWSAAAIDEGLNLVQAEDDPFACGNHSCDPNLWMADAITVVARRRIETGDEATIDYALVTVDESWSMECICGSPLCRQVVTGSDWQRRDLQQRYRDHFAPFINQRIHFEGQAT